MIPPLATYRIQFRNGMTFNRAAALVPYLKRLGISHLYASPIFSAVSGSTHGYDVTDANEIDPAIGGREGFDRLSDALKTAGLGLILDIVPNHMAASLENPWWRSVVELGEASPYARHFDIDWSRRLTLPVLAETFEKVLERGDLSVRPDPRTGKPALAYQGTCYPLTPSSYAGREAEVLATTAPDAIAGLHDLQPWRLIPWRDASRELSYRRFFEITSLVGMRVEDGRVFDDMHHTVLELVRTGRVDGLRIDHVDGLADPKAYLERLRHEVGPDIYIVVEKILGEGEHLPADWPVSGTTGYELISALADVFVDGRKAGKLTDAYTRTSGSPVDVAEELRQAKLLMVNNNFAGEFAALLRMAVQIQRAEDWEAPLVEDSLETALRELLVAFPVYRTYGTKAGLSPADRKLLAKVLDQVRTRSITTCRNALAFLERILIGDVEPPLAAKAALFRSRFQQLTGPLMAKSVEDTLFFRHHRLLALNEVGNEPLPRSSNIEHFHRRMETRRGRVPLSLSATSTHDTKRGEDARARLYAISEAPEAWAEAVERWRGMHRHLVRELKGGPAPEPELEWMLYQALAGVWPADLSVDEPEELEALEERFLAYVEKALREGKLRTSWNDIDPDYEQAVTGYARGFFSSEAFLADFTGTLQPFIRAGLANGLSQAILKLTAPGVPDIYQGSEALDFSLVDPDNRREPDFRRLETWLTANDAPSFTQEDDWRSGRLKQHVIATLLHLRQEKPQLFLERAYLPLRPSGMREADIVAFARADEADALIVILPHLIFAAFHDGLPRPDYWADTQITLPPSLAIRSYREIFTGEEFTGSVPIVIGLAFGQHPFAVLAAR
ncbi:malto-oligosyltrehalose synthase [Rhizobium sp. LC145]|uniref:malto-oligosyltrehalose synthase n=1 Tax=Rhizobium sp. LC145 TaxID=1120688 RepID=UPI000A551A16|nr:malto-oligosyltrehalose synthase [Rhizobium sp. LC145]TKT56750.1 malto-oligosyltrehalose synthase [Rhizobiaceae bacterium LC148]